MDEKKLEQAQSLEDEQLEDASGGARVFLDRTRAAANDNADNDEELDDSTDGIPHLPVIRPIKPGGSGGAGSSW